LAWLGLAWLGLAWLGLAWLGLAWLGLAWLGLAWLGLAFIIMGLLSACQVVLRFIECIDAGRIAHVIVKTCAIMRNNITFISMWLTP
jgi:hypothetical protein